MDIDDDEFDEAAVSLRKLIACLYGRGPLNHAEVETHLDNLSFFFNVGIIAADLQIERR